MPEALWSRWGGNAGETFFIDVEPLRTAPKLRWSKTLPANTLLTDGARLVGIGRGASAIVDAGTGEPLQRPRGSESDSGRITLTDRDLWVPRPEGIQAYDTRSGKKTWLFESAGPRPEIAWAPGTLVVAAERTVRTWLLGKDGIPSGEPSWSVELSGTREINTLLLAGERVIVGQRLGDSVALDRATGAERWRRDGSTHMADALGAIVHAREGMGWSMIDPDGRALWSNPGMVARALGPKFVACAPAFNPETFGTLERIDIHLLDRATGAARVLGSVAGTDIVCAMAGDVLFARVEKDVIGAWSLDGNELWKTKVPKLAWEINELAVAPGRLYGITGNGRAFCLQAT